MTTDRTNSREQRLKAALRENLRRRKARERAVERVEPDDGRREDPEVAAD